MRKEEVRNILVYLGDIQEKRKTLRKELETSVCREKRRTEIVKMLEMLDCDDAIIRSYLDRLHSKYRDVLMQRYVGRYSWVKVAGKLGASETTAKRYGSKAIERLVKSMDYEAVEQILYRAKDSKI